MPHAAAAAISPLLSARAERTAPATATSTAPPMRSSPTMPSSPSASRYRECANWVKTPGSEPCWSHHDAHEPAPSPYRGYALNCETAAPQNCQRPLPELFSRWFVAAFPCALPIGGLLLKASNFATGCARTIATTTRTTSSAAAAWPTRRGGDGSLRPSSASPAHASAVTTQAIPIQRAAWCPCVSPGSDCTWPLSSPFFGTSTATATAPAAPATAVVASAGHRLGARRRNATTPTAAATKAPREEVRYMTAARTGNGRAARALTTRERRDAMIASSRG